MNRIGLSLLFAVATPAALLLACSKDPAPANTPATGPYATGYATAPGQPGYPATAYPGAQPGYPAPGQPGAPTAYPPQPGAPTAAPTQPGGFPGFPPAPASGTTGGSAQSLDPNLAALATAPLAMYANTEAPGMAKEGPIVAGNFQEGQTLESTFTFQPGKCYTLVGQGAGISELDLEMQYVTPLPGFSPSIGKDSQTGAQASIGGKANCLRPISPVATQAKFIVKATRGSGVAAAQLYSK